MAGTGWGMRVVLNELPSVYLLMSLIAGRYVESGSLPRWQALNLQAVLVLEYDTHFTHCTVHRVLTRLVPVFCCISNNLRRKRFSSQLKNWKQKRKSAATNCLLETRIWKTLKPEPRRAGIPHSPECLNEIGHRELFQN